jgi:hypothetical protein
MEQLCERHRALSEATHAAHITMRESRALVALSRGKPGIVPGNVEKEGAALLALSL